MSNILPDDFLTPSESQRPIYAHPLPIRCPECNSPYFCPHRSHWFVIDADHGHQDADFQYADRIEIGLINFI